MADVVLFDLFGVIARVQSTVAKQRLAATAGVGEPAFFDAYWDHRLSYDRGDVTGPGYWRAVAATLGTAFDDRRVDRLIAADLASWAGVDDEMVDLVEETAATGRRIALLSNVPAELAAYCDEHHDWLGLFTVRAFSCRIGYAKPEPGAYRWCCRALGVEPGRVLFIDDRAENVEAARAIGMRGLVFDGPVATRNAIAELD